MNRCVCILLVVGLPFATARAQLVSNGRGPNEHIKIISATACNQAMTGWVTTPTYGSTTLAAANYVTGETGVPAGQGEVDLYCDALLPAEATAYDYAELEYFAPDESPNWAPTLSAFLDTEGQNTNGYLYSQTVALDSCQGPLLPLYRGTNPMGVCRTLQGQSFELDFDGGTFPGFWPLQDWTLFSIHFLVQIPVSPDPAQPNLVYRVIVHYEAP
jgi:hypothetical protein